MVSEDNAPFHTPGANQDSIGIEHPDVCNDPAPLTTHVYERSAALVRDIAVRHGFAIDVAGHVDISANHGDEILRREVALLFNTAKGPL